MTPTKKKIVSVDLLVTFQMTDGLMTFSSIIDVPSKITVLGPKRKN